MYVRSKNIRGLGVNPITAPVDCNSWWSLLDPAALFYCRGDAGDLIGSQYEQLQYGHIPRAGELPAPSAPGVPAGALTSPNSAGLTPGLTPEQQAAWVASQQAALNAAVSDGSWNPGGNLPVTADDVSKLWADHSTAIVIGAIAIGGLLLWKMPKV